MSDTVGAMLELVSIPDAIMEALERWKAGPNCPPGGFVRAVLENNLSEAMGRADLHSRAALFAIVRWCHWNLPGGSWGSPENVRSWLAEHRKDAS